MQTQSQMETEAMILIISSKEQHPPFLFVLRGLEEFPGSPAGGWGRLWTPCSVPGGLCKGASGIVPASWCPPLGTEPPGWRQQDLCVVHIKRRLRTKSPGDHLVS